MAAQNGSKSQSPGFVETSNPVGPSAYAIGILGNNLAPTLCDGQLALFDPDAGRALRGEIAAVWRTGCEHPDVYQLVLAVPPPELVGPELGGLLVVETDRGRQSIPMEKVRAVHRMVAVVEGSQS